MEFWFFLILIVILRLIFVLTFYPQTLESCFFYLSDSVTFSIPIPIAIPISMIKQVAGGDRTWKLDIPCSILDIRFSLRRFFPGRLF